MTVVGFNLKSTQIQKTSMLEYVLSGSVFTTVLVGLVAALVVYWLIQKWKYKYPPGPPSLPLIGHILQVDQKKLHEQCLEWSKKYGPVIYLKLGPMSMIVVNKIDAALEVLVKKSTDFAGRMSVPSIDVFTYGGKDIAFSNYGPTWKLHRKISSKALRSYMLGDALEHKIHDALETAYIEIDKVSGEFDPSEYINFIVVNILTSLCFGGKYNFADKEVTYILDKDDEFIEKFGMGPWEDFIPGLRHVYKTEMWKFMEDFTKEVIEDFLRPKLVEARETFDKNNLRHFTDNLLLARLEAEEEDGKLALEQLDDDRLVQTISDIFFAGIDTSRFTLKSAILHMAAFPDIQEKVYEEINRVVDKGRLPGLKDRPDLCYTEAVLHESMRLSSVAAMGLIHMALCDTDIAGYRIPKGTVVAINHWALHHDPEAWEEVDRFIPERYLDENGKLGRKPKNWLPFSAGKRVCLGEFVAKPELHLIFAGLMQRYKWTMKSGKCPDLTPTGGSLGLVCKPYKIMFERRI